MTLQVALAFASLFEQSVAQALEKLLADTRVSYLAMNVQSGEIFASRWEGVERPVPPGSLVKPFLATLGRAEAKFECPKGRCWLAQGHGPLRLREAIAESCNVWFLELSSSVSHAAMQEMALRFGLPEPPPDRRAWVGLADWPIPPATLVRAFSRLGRSPGAAAVRDGMALAARSGTARLAGAEALMKTGTAPCTHAVRAPGDGFALAMFPVAEPAYVVLVRVHGTTGAIAAVTAGKILRAFRATP